MNMLRDMPFNTGLYSKCNFICLLVLHNMDQYHRDIVHKAVKIAASKIDGRLPDLPSHPNGRIPMAHIYQVIQTIMECPSRECSNARVDDILSIIQDCVDLVDVADVSANIKHKYVPQTKHVTSTLEDFFK